jgi:hypothetical protein
MSNVDLRKKEKKQKKKGKTQFFTLLYSNLSRLAFKIILQMAEPPNPSNLSTTTTTATETMTERNEDGKQFFISINF